MKRISSMLALSLALVMVLGMTALAYNSPTVSSEAGSGVKAGVVSGALTNVEELSNFVTADEYNSFTKELAGGLPAGAQKDAKPHVIAVLDLDNLDSSKPVKGDVTLNYSGISAKDGEGWIYYAYHLTKDGKCEVLRVIPGDGKITIKGVSGFSNYVLVAFAKDPNFKDPTNTGEGGNNNGTADGTSPKTGESTSMAMLIVLVSLAGASVLGAKRAFSAR